MLFPCLLKICISIQVSHFSIRASLKAQINEMGGQFSAARGVIFTLPVTMTIGIKYSADYDDPNADVYVYSASSSANINLTGLTLYGVLPKFKKQGNHGEKFHYVTANTDALGWVLQRASNRSLAELLTTEIWSKIGAERDALVISDLNGTPWMGGGMNSTLRDTARFGLRMLPIGLP